MESSNSQHPDVFGNVSSTLEERFGEQLEHIRETVATLNQKALRVIREYPGLCLVGAVGVGFLIGRLASRR